MFVCVCQQCDVIVVQGCISVCLCVFASVCVRFWCRFRQRISEFACVVLQTVSPSPATGVSTEFCVCVEPAVGQQPSMQSPFLD